MNVNIYLHHRPIFVDASSRLIEHSSFNEGNMLREMQTVTLA